MEKATVVSSEKAPPVIGNCSKCQTEIRASHPYSWCIKCNEQLPYRINMERRPIIYGTPHDWLYTFGIPRP